MLSWRYATLHYSTQGVLSAASRGYGGGPLYQSGLCFTIEACLARVIRFGLRPKPLHRLATNKLHRGISRRSSAAQKSGVGIWSHTGSAYIAFYVLGDPPELGTVS